MSIRDIVKAASIVAPVFEAQQWKWTVCGGRTTGKYVPAVEDIVVTLARLIDDADDDTIFAQSGRLAIRFDKEDGHQMFLSLGHLE